MLPLQLEVFADLCNNVFIVTHSQRIYFEDTVAHLEEVFKLSGVPTYTFVKPLEFSKLLVAMRTPGRGVVIEGPSGIGKSTAVAQALHELGIDKQVLTIRCRDAKSLELLTLLLDNPDNAGTVIIDDFHVLKLTLQRRLADLLKIAADEERKDIKLVLIGINQAGQSLISLSPDLTARIDTIPFETNPDERVQELIEKGEKELNVKLDIKPEIITAAGGSFYLAQMLSHETCLLSDVDESVTAARTLLTSYETVRDKVMTELSRRFEAATMKFAAGTRLRREGRAPYLHILKWLAESEEWSIGIDREISKHPDHRASVGTVVDHGYLNQFFNQNEEFRPILHYDHNRKTLTVEDPQFVFYLRNLNWSQFAKTVGFYKLDFVSKYDFALSFAGTERKIAEELCNLLQFEEFAVFYDRNEQHRIAGQDVEAYLKPIYNSEAAYVICLLSSEYPKRIWTKIESQEFKHRFNNGTVIPIWFTDAMPGIFDESARVGGFTFDFKGDQTTQLQVIVNTLRQKLAGDRVKA